MINVIDVTDGQTLGSMMESLLELACENAVEDLGGDHFIDGLDTLWRQHHAGHSPGHGIEGLVNKGYLVFVGLVPVKEKVREVKRYRIVVKTKREK